MGDTTRPQWIKRRTVIGHLADGPTFVQLVFVVIHWGWFIVITRPDWNRLLHVQVFHVFGLAGSERFWTSTSLSMACLATACLFPGTRLFGAFMTGAQGLWITILAALFIQGHLASIVTMTYSALTLLAWWLVWRRVDDRPIR